MQATQSKRARNLETSMETRATGGKSSKTKLVGVDVFSGAGGLSLGAVSAGVAVLVSVEKHRWAATTYASNHPGTIVLESDVRGLAHIHLPRSAPLVIFGGPPCQGFSTSNQRTRTPTNASNWMFEHFLSIVKRSAPEWVVFENVAGFTHTAQGLFRETVERRFERLGYTIASGLLNSVEFGVPQHRSRYFLIGSRMGVTPSLPKPQARVPRITVWDAIGDLPRLTNGAQFDTLPYRSKPLSAYASALRDNLAASTNHWVSRNASHIVDRYRFIGQGENWEAIPKRMMRTYTDRTRCHTGIYHRLDADKPSIVIGNYRKNMLIHPYEDRGLSVREAARLQSFPDWYEFTGSIGLRQQQVGNAVPPLLARAVFSHIVSMSTSHNCDRGRSGAS